MLNLAIRGLKIFFRQKSAVFFSLLSVFIIIGLYAVFLGDTWGEGYALNDTKLLLEEWLLAGILSVGSVTTTLGAYAILINDRSTHITRDFLASPLRRSQIIGGYILTANMVGLGLSMVALLAGEMLLVAGYGGTLLSPLALLKLMGVMALSVLAASTLLFFLVSFFSSASAFSTASTIIGTLIGFLAGIYLPIGTLPDMVQWLVKLFPFSHAAALMRQILLADSLSASFAGAPPQALTQFETHMGVTLTFSDRPLTPLFHIAVLLATAVLFALLSLWRAKKAERLL